ncbi:hypothetical protein M9H77_33252 [Catharanthus roseus]|uniref:Uncharacterized protein n=1 Tax=Catharanthus roseus TaxID=4058 RepID=A0ACB9ZK06_CATRO|nr:hypothetical protein M9H77_33252 [Catharanthus roseus]
MKGGTLEVLLVSAKGIGRTSYIIGKSKYFVILQCGNQVYKSKTSKGNREGIRWNEKFKFELPNFTEDYQMYLKVKIMERELGYFKNSGLVGETIIYLKGVIIEGIEKGQVQVTPAPYNVVLDDDTFKGQINIGLKFTTELKPDNKEEENIGNEKNEEIGVVYEPICKTLLNFWKVHWKKIFNENNNNNNR